MVVKKVKVKTEKNIDTWSKTPDPFTSGVAIWQKYIENSMKTYNEFMKDSQRIGELYKENVKTIERMSKLFQELSINAENMTKLNRETVQITERMNKFWLDFWRLSTQDKKYTA